MSRDIISTLFKQLQIADMLNVVGEVGAVEFFNILFIWFVYY